MFCIGAFVWPSLGGVLMDRFGADAMPFTLVLAFAAFLPIVAGAWIRGPSPNVRR